MYEGISKQRNVYPTYIPISCCTYTVQPWANLDIFFVLFRFGELSQHNSLFEG